MGDDNYITYKGAKLDSQTKTRREIEVPLGTGAAAAADAAALLEALGFSRVAEVRKVRRHSTLRWQGRPLEMAIDEVEGLGDFVELEIVTGEADLAAARDVILAVADHLGLVDSERRSYLELLLMARGAAGSQQ